MKVFPKSSYVISCSYVSSCKVLAMKFWSILLYRNKPYKICYTYLFHTAQHSIQYLTLGSSLKGSNTYSH